MGEIIIDMSNGSWFGEVMEAGQILYRTGPRPNAAAAEYSACQWAMAKRLRIEAVHVVDGAIVAE